MCGGVGQRALRCRMSGGVGQRALRCGMCGVLISVFLGEEIPLFLSSLMLGAQASSSLLVGSLRCCAYLAGSIVECRHLHLLGAHTVSDSHIINTTIVKHNRSRVNAFYYCHVQGEYLL